MKAHQRKFEMEGVRYATGILAADVQFNIARRVMPVMNTFQSVGVDLIKKGKLNVDEGLEGVELNVAELMTDLMGPISMAMASMPQDDVDAVMYTCLGACERQDATSGSWTRVAAGKNIMFDDMGGEHVIRIIVETIAGNLSNFFPLLRAILVSGES